MPEIATGTNYFYQSTIESGPPGKGINCPSPDYLFQSQAGDQVPDVNEGEKESKKEEVPHSDGHFPLAVHGVVEEGKEEDEEYGTLEGREEYCRE